MTRLELWELGVLGIHDYLHRSKFSTWFAFLRDHHRDVPGDVAEVGVYQGSSLLATALLLRELGSDKRVVGFDSFSGFPATDSRDDMAAFDKLLADGRMTQAHYEKVKRNRRHLAAVGRTDTAGQSSSSGKFELTSRELVERKARYLGLDNIELVEGPYSATMVNPGSRVWCAGLLDCDLYESYRIALPFLWTGLSQGGFLFLDEYFSLKFPGARMAVDEFFADLPDAPVQVDDLGDGFERWGVYRAEPHRMEGSRS